jgi:hypothetical protein
MPKRRLYDLLQVFPVDSRTLRRAVKAAGYQIHYIGKRSGPLISEEDFEKIRDNGIPYYKDTMTKNGIK